MCIRDRINAVSSKTTRDGIAIINIIIEISSTAQLEQVVKKLSRIGGVFEVTRKKSA